MNFKNTIPILLLMFGCNFGFSTSRTLPFTQSYASPDNQFTVKITPAKLPERRLYDYLIIGLYSEIFRKAASTKPEDLVSWVSFSSVGVSGEKLHWLRPLDLIVSPLDVSISNTGHFLVIGDWFNAGGKNEFCCALYDRFGTLIVKYKLSDVFNDGQIAILAKKMASIWWSSISIRSIETIKPDDPFSFKGIFNVYNFNIELSPELAGIDEFPHGISIIMNGAESGKLIKTP